MMKSIFGVAGLSLAFALGGCSKVDAPAKLAGESTHADHADHAHSAAPATSPAVTAGYPLTVCIVAGEKLGSMGEPVIYMHEGREVRFCCTNCETDFKNDPKKYLAKMDEMIKSGAKPATQPAGQPS